MRASRGVERNAWTPVLQRAGITATVDIVSGASAGGINGVLLGKALATGAELSSVRSLWIDQADIGTLLRDAGEKEPASLLQTGRMREILDSGLARMDATATGKPLVSAFDLFVAGTRLEPWVRSFPTDLGGAVGTRDYRKVFNLKMRQRGYNPERREAGYDRNDFLADANPTLADVAQATSAFPVAFEPRLIEIEEGNRLLFDPGEPESSYFSDGGILHNKPFTETISTIFSRAAGGPVDRWLVSVEPDPERIPAPGDATEPNVAEVASKAVMAIPRYQSIAADLARLQEHRRRVIAAREKLAGIDERLRELIDAVRPDDDESREAAIGRWRDEVLEASDYFAERARHRARFLARLAAPADTPDGQALDSLRGVLEALDLERAELPDPEFEQRRIYHLLEMTRGLQAHPDLPREGDSALAESKLQLWAQFDRVDELVWRLSSSGPEASEAERAAPRAVQLIGGLNNGLAAVQETVAAICEDLDRHSFVALDDDQERFSTVFRWFELWDAQLLTIAELSDVRARDEIRFARISPADARYVDKPASEKLAGDQLGHFGGFLKESWRRNDLLWGRLDAAEIICRMIERAGDEAGPASLPEDDIRAVQEEIAAAELPELTSDYRVYLERRYEVGNETLADIRMDERADLALRGSEVGRNMLRGLGNADRLPRPLRWFFARLGAGFGLLLAFVRWPVRAAFGRDAAVRRAIDLALLFIGLWSIASLVLIALGVIGTTSTLWTLIGAGLLLFLLWTAAHAIRRA